jgi:hypothetical protein
VVDLLTEDNLPGHHREKTGRLRSLVLGAQHRIRICDGSDSHALVSDVRSQQFGAADLAIRSGLS